MTKINTKVLSKLLGIDVSGFGIQNRNNIDGKIEFTKSDNGYPCETNSTLVLTSKGKMLLKEITTNGVRRVKGAYVDYMVSCEDLSNPIKKRKTIKSIKAKIVLAALGEIIDPRFARKYAKQIRSVRIKLFTPPKRKMR
jgi:hypothetical protein